MQPTIITPTAISEAVLIEVNIFFDERRETVFSETPRDETLGRLHGGGLGPLCPDEGEEPSQVLVLEESLGRERSAFLPPLLVDLDGGSLHGLDEFVGPAAVLLACVGRVGGFLGGFNGGLDLGFDDLVGLLLDFDRSSSFPWRLLQWRDESGVGGDVSTGNVSKTQGEAITNESSAPPFPQSTPLPDPAQTPQSGPILC